MVPVNAGAVSGRPVYVGDKTAAQIQAMAEQLRGAIVLTHLPQAEFVDRDRPQPGLDERPVATGNPSLPQARSTTPANELMTLLGQAGAAVALRPSAYRDGTVGVTGNRATPSDAVPSIVVAGEQYNVLARLAAQGRRSRVRVELRTRYFRRGPEQLQRHRRDPGAGSGAARSGRARWRAPRLVAHRERRH